MSRGGRAITVRELTPEMRERMQRHEVQPTPDQRERMRRPLPQDAPAWENPSEHRARPPKPPDDEEGRRRDRLAQEEAERAQRERQRGPRQGI